MDAHNLLEQVLVYLPLDWRQALAKSVMLPEYTRGAALFADISGFTPLVEALAQSLGLRRGAEELSAHLNRVYDALIEQVNRYGGSVVSFAGDAITCWFDAALPDVQAAAPAWRAAACALSIQQAMQPFASVSVAGQESVALAVKVAIASGPARRFLLGDPSIQRFATLAGATLARMAAAEHQANRGEVILDEATAQALSRPAQLGEWRTDVASGERFAVLQALIQYPPPAPWPPNLKLSTEQVKSWVLPDVYERLKGGLGDFITELRPAVTLFLRFGGLDFDNDPQAGARLDAYINWVQKTLGRCGGNLLQLTIGDKGCYLYAAFGAPVAHEDDVRHALTAALDLQSPPAELSFIGPVQMGLSQGLLRTGAYGGAGRRTYGVLGDHVNVSARLMQAAEPGQIIVNQKLQKSAAEDFHWELLQPIQVKGKSAPVAIARLAGRRNWQAEGAHILRQYPNPLVGRQTEQEWLHTGLDKARQGQGQIIFLSGDAGVGKSRLAVEFARQAVASGVRVCAGVCQSTTQHLSYAAWRPIFQALFNLTEIIPESAAPGAEAHSAPEQIVHLEQALNEFNPSWRIRLPLLGPVLGLQIPDNETTQSFDARVRQEALLTMAVDIVLAYARQQPLMLVIEDAHWIDEASEALLLAVGRVVAQRPLLLMIVHRSAAQSGQAFISELEDQPGCRLELRGLPPEAIAELLTKRLDGQLTPLVLGLLQAQAQGNPFFAEQLADAMRESGKLISTGEEAARSWDLAEDLIVALQNANCLDKDPANGQARLRPEAPLANLALDMPSSVHGAVLARLDKLPEPHKLTLKVASVIGRIFELVLLARVHPSYPGREAFDGQLQTFQQREFAEIETPPPNTAYIFRHNVTHEVIYGTLLEAQQRNLHRAVGAMLERLRPDAIERLVYHFTQAGLREKAIFYLDKAARKAQHEFANETALAYYNQALALEERWEWRQGQVEVLHILGRSDEERQALEALESNPEAPPFEVAKLWGQYYETVSDYPAAQAAVERAITYARDNFDQLSEASCLAQLGLIARRQGEYERARACFEQAQGLFFEGEANTDDEARVLASVLDEMGIVLRQQGSFEAANSYYQRALALYRRIGNRQGEANVFNGMGNVAYYQRDFLTAIRYHSEALEIRRAIGYRSAEGSSLTNLAQSTRDMGNYVKAEEHLNNALYIQKAVGNRWEEANVCNDLGVLHQNLGQLERAQECLSHGLDLARAMGDEAGQVYLLVNLAVVMYQRDELEATEKLLLEGLELARKTGEHYIEPALLSQLGLLALKNSQPQKAIEYAEQALSKRMALNLRIWTTDNLATLAQAHWQLGNQSTALEFAHQALALLDECGGQGPECPQQDYFNCYQVLLAAGETEPARWALRNANRLVSEHANQITDPALRQSFLENVPINRQITQAVSLTPPGDQ